MSSITVNVSDKLSKSIEVLAHESRISVNDIINEAITRYVNSKKLKQINSRLSKYAEKFGYTDEEKIFDDIS